MNAIHIRPFFFLSSYYTVLTSLLTVAKTQR